MLSEIAGMPEREVGDLMKAAVGNGKRLRACAGHRFTEDLTPERTAGKRWRCTVCCGEVDWREKSWYEAGLAHGKKDALTVRAAGSQPHTKAVLEAVQNVAAATGRPVYVLLGQRTPCALDEVLALPHVCAVARGPREDEGVAVFAEGSVPPPAEMGLLTWHRKEKTHGG